MEAGAVLAWWISGVGSAMTFIGAKAIFRSFLIEVVH